MDRAAIVVLLVVTAIADLFGTITVAVNYWKGARLAEMLRSELETESNEVQDNPMMAALKDLGPAFYQHLEVKDRLGALRGRVADQLSASGFLTAGLVAFAVAALAGLAAGLLALS